ncbi:MAG: RimK-like ATPgrasp N-terminal domain-containing protein [Trueperaceae bacterium]|nr:MAG: RimK-like ATPgrasp N-terminal domain-containing protein [Trueperaceae bacterium]
MGDEKEDGREKSGSFPIPGRGWREISPANRYAAPVGDETDPLRKPVGEPSRSQRYFHAGNDVITDHPWARGVTFNVAGDYRYLSDGYYASLEAELRGWHIHPTTSEALDGYIAPIAAEKAARGGLAVPESSIVLDTATLPALVHPVNPFSHHPELIYSQAEVLTKLGTLTRVGKYVAFCQHLPESFEIKVLPCIFGRTPDSTFEHLLQRSFDVFKLPLMRVRLIDTDKTTLFSGIEPLPLEQLTSAELALVEELGTWQT